MSQPKVAIAITADDKTARGARSAEKRLGGITKRVSRDTTEFGGITQRAARSWGRTFVQTFGAVDQAASRTFGSGGSAGIIGRVAALGRVGGAAASGLGAVEAGVVGIGGAAVATGAAVVALGAAVWNLGSKWSNSARDAGRMAAMIGVSTKGLTAFAGAAERAGVDKGVATGALGGLSQTLNDARYGRNTTATTALALIGARLKLKEDGDVDVEAMLPAIADGIARQTSSGKRTLAGALGISLEALPAFTQGGKALSGDIEDYAKRGTIYTDADAKEGAATARNNTIAAEVAKRTVVDPVMRGSGHAVGAVQQAVIGAIDSITKPAGSSAAGGGGITKPSGNTGRTGGGVTKPGITPEAIAAAQASQRKWGIPASVQLAQYGAESSYGRNMPRGSNNPFGIKARRGQPHVMAWTREVVGGRSVRVREPFRKYNNLDEAFDDHGRLLAQGRAMAKFRSKLPNVMRAVEELGGGTPKDPRYATASRSDYAKLMQDNIRGRNLQQYDKPIPVEVRIRFEGDVPRGTSATATAGSGSQPSISYAFPR